MSNKEYDANLEAAVSAMEEVVLLDTVLEELKKEKSSRGYIVVKTDPSFQKYGFKSLGIAYKKVSDSPSLDSGITPGDFKAFSNYIESDIKLSPYIKYSSLEEKIISEPEAKSILEAIRAKSLFLVDSEGGWTMNLGETEGTNGLQILRYIPSFSADYLKMQGVLKEEELKPYDTHEE